MRCWKMFMLNHPDHPKVQLDIEPNLERTLRCNSFGLAAGGDSTSDMFQCPSINQKLEDICPNCQFCDADDAYPEAAQKV